MCHSMTGAMNNPLQQLRQEQTGYSGAHMICTHALTDCSVQPGVCEVVKKRNDVETSYVHKTNPHVDCL